MSNPHPHRRVSLELGRIVATLDVIAVCPHERILSCVKRHGRGDWGCVSRGEWSRNDEARRHGSRVVSAYPIDTRHHTTADGWNTFLIVTDADRKLTIVMLPREFSSP
jgi:hypothetical protein